MNDGLARMAAAAEIAVWAGVIGFLLWGGPPTW